MSAEPLTAEEIAALEVWLANVERTQPPGDKLAVTAVAAVARLLATVRDRETEGARLLELSRDAAKAIRERDEEIARLRADLRAHPGTTSGEP